MNKPATTPATAPQTLAQQETLFTAEGSPPPGKVSASVPVTPTEPGRASPPPVPARATIRLKRAAKSAKP